MTFEPNLFCDSCFKYIGIGTELSKSKTVDYLTNIDYEHHDILICNKCLNGE